MTRRDNGVIWFAFDRKSHDATLLAGNCALACFARCGCRRDIGAGVAGVSGADPICRERTRTGHIEFNELVCTGRGSPKRTGVRFSLFLSRNRNKSASISISCCFVCAPSVRSTRSDLIQTLTSYLRYVQRIAEDRQECL